jgi:ketosteroid isomerase-like protein
MSSEFTQKVFAMVDAGDAAGFAALFGPRGHLVFGNAEPIIGPAAIVDGVKRFFTTIKGLHHTVVHEWTIQHETVVELEVTYERLDGRSVTLPVVSIWHTADGGRIESYRVFFDLAPVYATA